MKITPDHDDIDENSITKEYHEKIMGKRAVGSIDEKR